MSIAPVASDSVTVVWKPLPGLNGFPGMQELALSCPANIIFCDGSRGPGKTDVQLMKFLSLVGKGYGKFHRGIIFDRRYRNLDDIVAKSERWFPQFRNGARFLRSKGEYKWVWPTGEELLFRAIEKDGDYWNYHGQEFSFIGWNELTKFPTPKPFDLMMSCNRTGFVPEEYPVIDPKTGEQTILPPLPLTVFITTNPYGPGHKWVKKRFVDPAPPGKLVWTETEVFNPSTGQREVTRRSQTRLFGSYKENRYLALEYIAVLEGITDENRRKAWLEGDWNIVAGGALEDVWKDNVHVIPRFQVPSNWRVFRSMDWGSSHPFSVGWYCEANGETVKTVDGRHFTPRRGSLIRFAEWYGAKKGGDNEGVQMSPTRVAEGIIDREMALLEDGWIKCIPGPGPADNQIFNHPEGKEITGEFVQGIADKMAAAGIEWTRSDKSKGSRINGLVLLREALECASRHEGAGLYFTENCREAISLLPIIPRDPDNMDDVDTEAEDHLYDEVRYTVLSCATRWAKTVKLTQPI